MLQLYNGRPESAEGRLPREIAVYELLDRLNIEYARIDHEPAMTMEACAEIDRALGATICKNLFLCNRQRTQFYLLLIRDTKRFKTKELSQQLGVSRLSFGDEAQMERLLGVSPGSVSVMGLMNDAENAVQLLIDEDILEGEEIGVHPCVNTSSIKFRTEELMRVVLPAMGHEAVFVRLLGE